MTSFMNRPASPPVNDPVVEREGKMKNLPNDYGVVLDPRSVLNPPHAEYRDVRIIFMMGVA